MEAKEEKSKKADEIPVPEGKMLIKVYAPFKDYFEGPANSITAENETGVFDILPGHKRFLTLLKACELDIRTDEEAEKIKIERGVMYVKKDRVTVFLDV